MSLFRGNGGWAVLQGVGVPDANDMLNIIVVHPLRPWNNVAVRPPGTLAAGSRYRLVFGLLL